MDEGAAVGTAVAAGAGEESAADEGQPSPDRRITDVKWVSAVANIRLTRGGRRRAPIAAAAKMDGAVIMSMTTRRGSGASAAAAAAIAGRRTLPIQAHRDMRGCDGDMGAVALHAADDSVDWV